MSPTNTVTAATEAGAAVPSSEQLIERAVALRELLSEDAPVADRDRVLTSRVVDAVQDAGLFKLLTPKRLGGYETDAATMLEVLIELGRGCSNTSWVGAVINFAAWNLALFGEQAQDDVWKNDPDARVCWVFSPTAKVERTEGGIIVTGRWPFASGCAHVQWATLAVPLGMTDRGPELAMALLPMTDLTIEDTWNVAGIRGSGSNTLIAEQAFVPEHRLLPLAPAMEGKSLNPYPEETLYRSSFNIGGLALLAPQIGLARTLLEWVLQKANGRPIPPAGVKDQSEWLPFQTAVAEASVRIDSAYLLACRAAVDVDAAAQTGALPSDFIRTRMRYEQGWASSELKAAVSVLMGEAGTSALADGETPQRLWRDITTANSHIGFRLAALGRQHGMALAGKDVGRIWMG